MTGGGDLDEIEDTGAPQEDDVDIDDEDDDVSDATTPDDDDPTAGASDIGGRAGEDDDDTETDTGDVRGADAHEVGGGQTGMGKGPTGS